MPPILLTWPSITWPSARFLRRICARSQFVPRTVIDQLEFESRVKAPVRKCLATVGKQKILYIVFSYQTPYVLNFRDRAFALDQFVADIWDEYASTRPGIEMGAHPYFADAQSQRNAYRPSLRLLPTGINLAPSVSIPSGDWTPRTPILPNASSTTRCSPRRTGLPGKGCFDRQIRLSMPSPTPGRVPAIGTFINPPSSPASRIPRD